MGIYIYTLSAPSKARTIHLLDGSTAKLVGLSYFCRRSDADPEDYYDEKQRRRRQCRSNVLQSKKDAWSVVDEPRLFVSMTNSFKAGDLEEGATVYEWPATNGGYDPIWFDCDKLPGVEAGVLHRQGRNWALLPSAAPLVVLAMQAL